MTKGKIGLEEINAELEKLDKKIKDIMPDIDKVFGVDKVLTDEEIEEEAEKEYTGLQAEISQGVLASSPPRQQQSPQQRSASAPLQAQVMPVEKKPAPMGLFARFLALIASFFSPNPKPVEQGSQSVLRRSTQLGERTTTQASSNGSTGLAKEQYLEKQKGLERQLKEKKGQLKGVKAQTAVVENTGQELARIRSAQQAQHARHLSNKAEREERKAQRSLRTRRSASAPITPGSSSKVTSRSSTAQSRAQLTSMREEAQQKKIEDQLSNVPPFPKNRNGK